MRTTYGFIIYESDTEKWLLVSKEDDNQNSFFKRTLSVIGGEYDLGDFKRYFKRSFETEQLELAEFNFEHVPLYRDDSTAYPNTYLVVVKVNEGFFRKTQEQQDNFTWILLDEEITQTSNEPVKAFFPENEYWLFKYLLEEYSDVVLDADLL